MIASRLLFYLCSFVLTASCMMGCNQPDTNTYRPKSTFTVADSVWGKTKSDVARSETLNLVKDEYNQIGYRGFVKYTQRDSLYAMLTYYFDSDRLNRIQFFLKFKSNDDSAYIKILRTVSSILTKQYGKPASTRALWSNKIFQDDPTMLGRAIRLGHVTHHAEWDTKLTRLKYMAYSQLDGDFTFSLEYFSLEYNNQFSREN